MTQIAQRLNPIKGRKKFIDLALPVDTIEPTRARLAKRKKERQSLRYVTNSTPTLLGAALVVPEHPVANGRQPEPRHIEVKGRVKGQDTICVTKNEIIAAANQGDKFVLAIVLVDREDDTKVDGPYYIRNPFDREPGWGVASIHYHLKDLLARAQA